MANDKTQDRTTTAGVQMDDGNNDGKQVARPTPNAQRASTARDAIQVGYDGLLADVEANRPDLVKFLGAFGIDYEFFVAGLRIFLMKTMQDPDKALDFFTKVTPRSFMEALFRCAKDGLVPDGKEAAIGHFKGVATYMPMRDGFVKVLWRTGMVKDINDNVVTEAEESEGRFEYEEGTEGQIRHRPSMKRTDADKTIAAYCVIRLLTGGEIREVVTQDELRKIAGMSRSPARKEWKFQMDRKAAIRRAMGKLPREKAIVQLLAHDDLNYDVRGISGPSDDQPRAVPKKSLFGNTAAVVEGGENAKTADRGRPAPSDDQTPPADDRQDDQTGDAGAEVQGDDDPTFSPERAAAILKALKAIEDADGAIALGEITTAMDADKALDGCTPEERGRLKAAVHAKLAAFQAPAPALVAILTKADGEQTFDDPRVWEVEIVTKMGALTGKPLQAFWLLNLPHIAGASGDFPDHVARIMERAKVAGLGGEA